LAKIGKLTNFIDCKISMKSPLTARLHKQLKMLRQFASSGHRTPMKTILL
jgi:hypothetical protein